MYVFPYMLEIYNQNKLTHHSENQQIIKSINWSIKQSKVKQESRVS